MAKSFAQNVSVLLRYKAGLLTLSAKKGGFTETFDVGNSDLTLKEVTHNLKGQM